MRAWLLLSLAFLVTPAAAQSPPRTVEVRLSSFAFAPETIHLRAGEPVVLHLVNSGSGGHDFSAPQFFAAAQIAGGPVQRGKVEVGGHQAVDVRLTPRAGRYRLRCTHTLHSAFGMRGEILVD